MKHFIPLLLCAIMMATVSVAAPPGKDLGTAVSKKNDGPIISLVSAPEVNLLTAAAIRLDLEMATSYWIEPAPMRVYIEQAAPAYESPTIAYQLNYFSRDRS